MIDSSSVLESRRNDEPSPEDTPVVKVRRDLEDAKRDLEACMRKSCAEGKAKSYQAMHEFLQALRSTQELCVIAYQAAKQRDEELQALKGEQLALHEQLKEGGRRWIFHQSAALTLAAESKEKIEGIHAKTQRILREQEEAKVVVAQSIEGLVPVWRVLDNMFQEVLASHDPVVAVYLARWLKSDYHWLAYVSTLGLELSTDCELRSQKCHKVTSRTARGIVDILARARWGKIPPGTNGYESAGVRFLVLNQCF